MIKVSCCSASDYLCVLIACFLLSAACVFMRADCLRSLTWGLPFPSKVKSFSLSFLPLFENRNSDRQILLFPLQTLQGAWQNRNYFRCLIIFFFKACGFKRLRGRPANPSHLICLQILPVFWFSFHATSFSPPPSAKSLFPKGWGLECPSDGQSELQPIFSNEMKDHISQGKNFNLVLFSSVRLITIDPCSMAYNKNLNLISLSLCLLLKFSCLLNRSQNHREFILVSFPLIDWFLLECLFCVLLFRVTGVERESWSRNLKVIFFFLVKI